METPCFALAGGILFRVSFMDLARASERKSMFLPLFLSRLINWPRDFSNHGEQETVETKKERRWRGRDTHARDVGMADTHRGDP